MWPFCLANNPLWLLLPFAIGLLAGWWAWGRRIAIASSVEAFSPPAISEPQPLEPPSAPQPVAAPIDRRPADGPAATGLTAIGIPAAVGDPDKLTNIKGIGPALNTLLQSLGVSRFDQIAAWTSEHIGIVDSHLGSFKGRIARDNWVDQARLLASGALEEFERRYGTIGSEHRK